MLDSGIGCMLCDSDDRGPEGICAKCLAEAKCRDCDAAGPDLELIMHNHVWRCRPCFRKVMGEVA